MIFVSSTSEEEFNSERLNLKCSVFQIIFVSSTSEEEFREIEFEMFSISLNKWFFTCVTKAVKGKILNKVSAHWAER